MSDYDEPVIEEDTYTEEELARLLLNLRFLFPARRRKKKYNVGVIKRYEQDMADGS